MKKQQFDILIEQTVKPTQLSKEQIKWLDKYVVGKWESSDGVVNVVGNVECGALSLTAIPVQFGKISGDFYCGKNQFTSFNHFPTKIDGDFWCQGNPFILNDKLFDDLSKIETQNSKSPLLRELKRQIPVQFGITDESVIEEIWQSYMNILEAK